MTVYVLSAGNGGTEYPNFLQYRLTLPPVQLRIIVPMSDMEAVHCYINMAVQWRSQGGARQGPGPPKCLLCPATLGPRLQKMEIL